VVSKPQLICDRSSNVKVPTLQNSIHNIGVVAVVPVLCVLPIFSIALVIVELRMRCLIWGFFFFFFFFPINELAGNVSLGIRSTCLLAYWHTLAFRRRFSSYIV
jgi:hypothetical protein